MSEKFAVASLISIHHLRPRTGLVAMVQCQFKVTVWGIMFICGTSVCWQIKTCLESGPVTEDLTPTVVHSYK